MGVIADKNSPVLRRIRILVDLIRDHLAQPRPLGKPFPGQAADRVPSHLNGSRLSVKTGLGYRNGIRLAAQPDCVLQRKFALGQVLLPAVALGSQSGVARLFSLSVDCLGGARRLLGKPG